MNIKEFQTLLASNPNTKMHWMMPDKSFVPSHFHITEVGKVTKSFVDCGGTLRTLESCVLQVWVADDLDHRLDTTKLSSIIDVARSSVSMDDNILVEIEYEDKNTSQYPIGAFELTPSGLLFYLGSTHTACLAPDKCGVGGKGCC